jgi:dihydrofolate reductase
LILAMPRITLVAAMARNRVIGRDGGMPWHLPADLAHFKALTLGHPVLMGRKTYESIGRPLPGRLNVVISRGQPVLPDEVVLAGSLDEAIAACAGHEELMVIGGGEIYRQALERADRLALTLIDAEVNGDTCFPDFAQPKWQLTEMSVRPADDRNVHRLVFAEFRRPS